MVGASLEDKLECISTGHAVVRDAAVAMRGRKLDVPVSLSVGSRQVDDDDDVVWGLPDWD